MKMATRGTEQGVTYTVSGANLKSGFDIVDLSVDGTSVPPTRVGEFETEAEAVKVAVERGLAFRESTKG